MRHNRMQQFGGNLEGSTSSLAQRDRGIIDSQDVGVSCNEE